MQARQAASVQHAGQGCHVVPISVIRAHYATRGLPTTQGAVLPSLCRGSSRRQRLPALCSAIQRAETVVTAPSNVLQQPAWTRLQDPARIGATGTASVDVEVFPGSPDALSQYMMLPVEQYFVLDPKQIRHLGGNRFKLTVPRVNIINVWLDPEVEISVSILPAGANGARPRVLLQAENCRIRGSDLIQNLRLDERFCMRFVTELTWDTPPMARNMSPARAASDGGTAPLLTPLGPGRIRGDATLDVWCEVVAPFHLMPRPALESTCNAVMRGLVGTLLPMFLRNLGADYQKWAQDPEYRAARAARGRVTSL